MWELKSPPSEREGVCMWRLKSPPSEREGVCMWELNTLISTLQCIPLYAGHRTVTRRAPQGTTGYRWAP